LGRKIAKLGDNTDAVKGGLYPKECDEKADVRPHLDAITVDDHLDKIEKLIFGIDLTPPPK
jgi:hypothetical protein